MELAQDIAERGKLDIIEGYRDETFVQKKMMLDVCKKKIGKGAKIMAIADAAGFAVAAYVVSASSHEVKLVEATIDSGLTQYSLYWLSIKLMKVTALCATAICPQN